MDQRTSATMRREQGYLNASEMADRIGANPFSFFYWIERGLVPRPTTCFAGKKRRYYTAKDVATIRKIVEGCRDE